MSKCLIAEFQTSDKASHALKLMEANGFTLKTVSVVSHIDDPSVRYLDDIQNESGSRNRSASLGMLCGGTIAAPITAGTLIGPFVIVGPLVGMALGAAIGGLVGHLQQWGVNDDISTDYEQRVKSGSTLIIVHHIDQDHLDRARELLETTDPESVQSFALASQQS